MLDKLIPEKVKQLEEYKPNTEICAIRLDANESPFLPSEAVLSEMAEALDGTDWKWWKNKKPRDPDYLKDEIVDMLHFLVSMALRSGMDADEIYARYMAKNKENFDRQHGLSEKTGFDASEAEK